MKYYVEIMTGRDDKRPDIIATLPSKRDAIDARRQLEEAFIGRSFQIRSEKQRNSAVAA